MNALYTADLHLTSNPDDEYRWSVFKWIRDLVRDEDLDAVFILGDLTDMKDEHPSDLVNRLVRQLRSVSELVPVFILKGNHDYVDASWPFFGFLDRVDRITYIDEPVTFKFKGLRFRAIPHVPKWRSVYMGEDFSDADRVLFHQAIQGAVGSNGHEVGGMPRSRFASAGPEALILGGDIHTAQTVGRARYVGAPHPIHFGDDYEPQALIEKNGRLKKVTRKTLRKLTATIRRVEDLAELDLAPEDRLRVTVKLPRTEFSSWPDVRTAIKEFAESVGVRLYGVKLKPKAERLKLRGEDEKLDLRRGYARTLDDFITGRGIDPETAALGRSLVSPE